MTPSARTRAPTCSRNDKKPKREPKRCFGSRFCPVHFFLLQPRELRAQGLILRLQIVELAVHNRQLTLQLEATMRL